MMMPPRLPVRNRENLPSDVVGFAARIDEQAGAQLAREGVGKLLGVIDDDLVEIAGVGRERRHLASDRPGHVRVGMPHGGHVVVAIEHGPAVGVVEPRPPAPLDMDGLVVEQHEMLAQQIVAACEQGVGLTSLRGVDIAHGTVGRIADCTAVGASELRRARSSSAGLSPRRRLAQARADRPADRGFRPRRQAMMVMVWT